MFVNKVKDVVGKEGVIIVGIHVVVGVGIIVCFVDGGKRRQGVGVGVGSGR